MKAIKLILLLVFFSVIFINRHLFLKDRDSLCQVSVINAFLKGYYDGDTDIKELKNHGDFGLGTFNHVDGEMIVLGNKFYQVKSDGKVYIAADSLRSPFAAVTFFSADKTIYISEPLDYEGLVQFIDNLVPTRNIPYAIKIEGKFDYVKSRSIPPQTKPYREFAEVVKDQTIFELRDVWGTMVGFRMPEYAQEINVGGYHLHFLSIDAKSGGHVLDCKVSSGKIELDDTYRLRIIFPKNKDFLELNLLEGENNEAAKAKDE
jgi:acetolactate decarboxylase